MAQAVSNLPIFAIGLGFREEFLVDYTKVFTPREACDDDPGNLSALQDFLRIAQEKLGYTGGSVVINLMGVDLEDLHQTFMEAGHYGSADFIEEAMKSPSYEHHDVVICIMTTDISMEVASLAKKLAIDSGPLPKNTQ